MKPYSDKYLDYLTDEAKKLYLYYHLRMQLDPDLAFEVVNQILPEEKVYDLGPREAG